MIERQNILFFICLTIRCITFTTNETITSEYPSVRKAALEMNSLKEGGAYSQPMVTTFMAEIKNKLLKKKLSLLG